jgi:hypothetical protein
VANPPPPQRAQHAEAARRAVRHSPAALPAKIRAVAEFANWGRVIFDGGSRAWRRSTAFQAGTGSAAFLLPRSGWRCAVDRRMARLVTRRSPISVPGGGIRRQTFFIGQLRPGGSAKFVCCASFAAGMLPTTRLSWAARPASRTPS